MHHLTHFSLETPKRAIGTQCRRRADAAESCQLGPFGIVAEVALYNIVDEHDSLKQKKKKKYCEILSGKI